ncbi:hypothetical protein [Kocuria tytonis]|uniref:DNA modification methylase n=1 Tax=Kocuria tytonis TaxID=2054280 RepID=A0A495A3D0_9MICC|nr:hypothetical protein [Kocuria tytonis]RKQ33621.1 hypothetical protein C1C97_010340 [Kocuria tytonis]
MKNAAHKKLQHLGAGVAALAVLTSVSGCSYISPQATMDSFAPADGVQMNLGDIQLRNVLVVAEGADSEGRVLGTVINNGDSARTVTLDAKGSSAKIEVPANKEVVLEKSKPVMLDRAGADPGLMVDTKFATGDQDDTVSVPVLDHTYSRYASFVPGGAPTTPANPSNTAAPEKHGEGQAEGGH